MKLLFVQLGDLHIYANEVSSDGKIECLSNALRTIGDVDEIFIVMCGDLSRTGKEEEYDAVRSFINKVIAFVKRINNGKSIYFYTVPGNHDLDMGGKERGFDSIYPLIKNERDSNYYKENKMLHHFFTYAKSKECFLTSEAIDSKIITLKKYRLQVNLINTAPFSSTKSIDDKRLHHIPHNEIDKLSKQDGVDFNIAIMHHNTEWFCDDTKRKLESVMYNSCDILFLGHEHNDSNTNYENELSQKIKVVRNGAFSVNGTTAVFNAVLLDTDLLSFTVYRFAWDADARIFKNMSKPKTDDYLIKHSQLYPSEEFLSEFMVGNHRLNRTAAIQDYFIFPKLTPKVKRKECRAPIVVINDFFTVLSKIKCICIEGGDRAGKTALLKSLYIEAANRGFVPLFLENKRSLDSRIDKLMKRLFEDQYGEDGLLYERYLQTEKSRKIIFVDDFDKIKHEGAREKLFEYLMQNNSHVILSTDIHFTTDLLALAKNQVRKPDVFTLQLQYMYKSSRTELVKKLCCVLDVNNEDIDDVVNIVDMFVSQTPELFQLSPDFIIRFLKHYLKDGEVPERKSSVIGAIFQSDITHAISSIARTQDVDIFLAVLDEIAYYIHFVLKKSAISANEIEQIICDYNELFLENVRPHTFVETMITANILVEDDISLGCYRFKDKNVLSYFIARRMSKDLERIPDDFRDLSKVIRNICFGINETIILFLSYLRMNVKLVAYFIGEAEQLLENVPELNVDTDAALFLRTPFITDDNRTISEKRAVKEREMEESEHIAYNENVKYRDIYDYDEGEADNPYYLIGRAIKCLEIVSKSLLSMRGNLMADEKDEIINCIYRLPNKILFKFFTPYYEKFDKFEELVSRFISEYTKKDVIPEDVVKSIILQASWSFILNLYDNIAFNCSDSNSLVSLDRFQPENINHRIQNLIMAENSDKTATFVEKAIKLYDSKDDELQRYLVRCVSEVHAIRHPRMSTSDLDRLNSKVLRIKKKNLLITRQRRKDK